MYWTVIFDIENCQEDYANCLKVAEYIGGNDVELEEGFISKVRVFSSEYKVSGDKLLNCESRAYKGECLGLEKTDNVTYLFLVDFSKGDDIVNIIYYCLVYDRISETCILGIKNSTDKMKYNIMHLLSHAIYKNNMCNCFFVKDGKMEEIKTGKVRKNRYFTPICKIDEEEEAVAYWRQSVHSFLLKLYKKLPVGSNEFHYTENYFLPHICPDKLSKKYPNDIKIDLNDYVQNRLKGKLTPEEIIDRQLMNIWVTCFCTGEIKEANYIQNIEKRYEYWKSKDLFELVKDMPLIAMYIFCMLNYFTKTEYTEFSTEQIKWEIYQARDMAEGILQILENVYHSEYKKGFFYFRVHNNSIGRSKVYLQKQYSDFMQLQTNVACEGANYLEIKIVDYSHFTIPKRFHLNFQKRMAEATDENYKIYQRLQEQSENIRVSSFFESSDFWHEYNSISENVIHHYGLQIFDSLISCYEGYFKVRSQENYKLESVRDVYCSMSKAGMAFETVGIPGTQYDILIPFRTKKELQNISLNVNINYTNYLQENYQAFSPIDFTTEYCTGIFNEIQQQAISLRLSFQEKKERTIYELARRLNDRIKQEEQRREEESEKKKDILIIHFSAEKIAITMVEMFCKAIMLYIAQKPKNSGCYIMITECSQSHFVEITRMMALFYDKQGNNSLMQGTQIFMSGKEEGEEFLITGTNLIEAIGSTEKLAFARCIHPDCLKTLKNMLKNHNVGIAPNEAVSIVPFDMVEYDNSKKTLFERSLQSVLNTDVQEEKFGCKLDKLHVRIGSKIHIRTFYEAELLFHNNYYTSRFAYWLMNKLCTRDEKEEFDITKPFILVGYENYSEMLLSELRNMLAKRQIETDYIIYEQKAIGKFRGNVSFFDNKDSQFVIIVPINSTITTHIKIAGFLEKTIRNALKKQNVENYGDYHLEKVFNYGIVLIADKDGNTYWKKQKDREKVIESENYKTSMKYYTEVISEWSNPLECEACFPKDDYTKEVPLVETNKESVVPMHAIGIRKKYSNVRTNNGVRLDEGLDKLKELSRFLIYDHIERNGNHFSYYFATEKLWDFPEIRENLQKWLESKKKLFVQKECKVYDIIVAPLHFSNTAFVEEVNTWLFSNAALVLHFDVDKEYRMNIRTKYSSLQQLYDNLCLDDEKSIINFHYVDDSIISGRTYSRMRSLISSVIKTREESKVVINTFKSIVLLVNRMSPASIKNYIEDSDYFLSYFNLNISSMRINSDACVLCKKYNEWNKLAEQASLNVVHDYWKKKREGIRCKSIEEIGLRNKEESKEHKMRVEQYMIASHRAKTLLDDVCNYATLQEIQEKMIDELFPEKVNDSIEELIAMLKVLGRPFLTFRKEEKEAIFELMLFMLETLLRKEEPEGNGKRYDILRQLWYNQQKRKQIITILLNRLAELGSNYIIRKDNICKLLDYSQVNITAKQEREEFINNYINRIKQLVGQSNDFAKGLYLEYLLLYDEEYSTNACEKEIISLSGTDLYATFRRNCYLENTKLQNYGIEYLADCFLNEENTSKDKIIGILNENYYFDNFIQYLAFHKMVSIDNTGKVTNISSKNAEKLRGMLRFQMLYQKIFDEYKILSPAERERQMPETDLRNMFDEMLDYLKSASGAEDADIIVPYHRENAEKYIALGLAKDIKLRALENEERKLFEFMCDNRQFEENTYAICNCHNGEKWILLRFADEVGGGNADKSTICMLFTFTTKDDGEILHALKNLLIFRFKIWRLLNLSSSTLLQNWTDDLFYKQQMLKSRASRHMQIGSLETKLSEMVATICKEDNSKKERVYRNYFDLLVDSIIGFMNSQVLGGRGRHYMCVSKMTIGEFWKGERDTFEAVSKIWNLEIEIIDKDTLFDKELRKCEKDEHMIPNSEILKVVFLAILQNAKKHGNPNNAEQFTVSVYADRDDLCIANNIQAEEKKKIEEKTSVDAYRVGEGISQAVIFDICKSWYSDIEFDKLFEVKEGADSKDVKYVVRLPILERMVGDENI